MEDVHAAPVDELEDADLRVTEPHPRLERAVDVLGRCDALLDEAHGLVHEQRLQPRADEPRRVAAPDRDLAEPLEERQRSRDDVLRRPGARHHLDERDDVRRVEPVGDQEALGALDGVHQVRGRDRRARGGQDRVGREPPREAPEDVPLEVEELGQRLLDEVARSEPVEPRPVLDAPERGRAVAEHAFLGHQREVARDLAPGVGEQRGPLDAGALFHVDEQRRVAPEREGERDLAPDPPGAEDRHRAHGHHAGSLP